MLVQLSISNLAIISRLETAFRPGLNILSGETGAGKSIIINAVNLILGGRASSELIRSGSEEARIEALFVLPANASLRSLFEEMNLPFQQETVIRRIISREGRNRITINDSLCTLTSLSRLGQSLISISGQHEHQLLLRPENHLFLLDEFGGLTEERLALSVLFERHIRLKEECRQLEREIKDREERSELSLFQMEEIDRAEIRQEEDVLLEEERRRLRNSDLLAAIVKGTYHALYERDGAVLAEIGSCLRKMEKGSELDQGIRSVRERLAAIKLDLEEVAYSLREMQERAPDDPFRLEAVEDRLQLLNKLKRKYGPSLGEVLDFRSRLSGTISDLDQKKESLGRASNLASDIEKEIVQKAADLSEKRKKAAKALERAAMDELGLLAMGGTRFAVRFSFTDSEGQSCSSSAMKGIRADGRDRIEFMLSTNVGEELKPLSRIASGGELSRIMLALKTILAGKGSVDTIVFDEVDSGIGGATAELVGEKLRSLSAYHQILCITHLPQIACKGETHFLVTKEVADKRTATVISQLNPEARVKEIARLLAGKTVSESAMAHAREILKVSSKQ
ncbi:MAG: DNA repair protein RecN [Desulfobacteraceae bacterium]|nr:MAG: DNA repair protein RecN [Desulfobacteraceae bacterium]